MVSSKDPLVVARGELGNTENPAGSNRTKYGKWMGLDGQPWCMSFLQWCFDQAGVKLPLKTGSCGELMRAAQKAGCWVTRDFLPRDVVIYDFPGGAATDHCGIVELPLPDYGVQAIEGNTSEAGSQDNGGMVCRKNRPTKYIVGAVRPQFDAEKEDDEMVYYKTLNDVPVSYRGTIRKLMEKGALKGHSDPDPSRLDDNVLDISDDMCRVLTVLDNLGKLD
ncbi:MAG: hypothetical protein HDT16_11815 [Oscillibacter sp.]|nr:hypothetical protein [Oscillibacter sp.]